MQAAWRQPGRWFLITMAAVLAACSTAPEYPPAPPEIGAGYTAKAYRIGAGDGLRVDVWRNEQLSVLVPVRPDGKISMPLIGDVMAADMTAPELAESISAKLTEYMRNPQVTVIVTNPDSADFQQRVRVTGAVRQAQSVAWRTGMTVLDLILLAGGLNDFASGNKAKLFRELPNGEVRVYPVYLDNILQKGRLGTNYPLLPSDIVSVPERSF